MLKNSIVFIIHSLFLHVWLRSISHWRDNFASPKDNSKPFQLSNYVLKTIIPLQTFLSYYHNAFGVMHGHGAADRER